MMPDETRPPVQQTVNVGDSGIFAGLSGWMKPLVAFGFAGVVAAAFWLLLFWSHADSLENRQLFRESVRDMVGEFRDAVGTIQKRADERAGEVKGSVDKNSEILRDLIAEMKAARREGHLPPAVPPKAAELRPPAGP
jgi:hypothetical protein